MSNGHRPVGAVGFAAAISSPHPPVARRSMNHEAAVADAKIDLLACSSAEGGHEQQQQAGGHLHGHCSGGECLEHSVPLRRMRAMEERTCARAPACLLQRRGRSRAATAGPWPSRARRRRRRVPGALWILSLLRFLNLGRIDSMGQRKNWTASVFISACRRMPNGRHRP